MAELVLCQPRVGDWDTLRSSPALPLSLLHAANLASREFETRLVDLRVDPQWRVSLKNAIGPETLAVGFTAYTGPMILSSLEMAEEARKLTDAPLVWGGIHPTLESPTTIQSKLVDIVVRGEGEETLIELLRALKQKKSLENIQGIWHKERGEIRRNPDRDLLDIESLPDIPYHLVDVNRYMPLYRGRKSFSLQSSRGCPHSCAYCFNPRFNGRRLRSKSPRRTLDLVRRIVDEFGPEDIYFVDDNFLLDFERDMAVVEGMKDVGVAWEIQGMDILRLKRLDEAQLKLLAESGLQRFTVGIESASPRVRKLMKKAGTVEDIEFVIRKLAKYDIFIYAGVIAGVPTETKEETRQTIEFILKLLKINPNMHNSPLYNYTPYPGTEMFDLAVENGFVPPKSLDEWGRIGGFEKFSWGNRPDSKFYEALYFVSNFIDYKTRGYDVPSIVKFLADLYRPVARWRVKHLNFDFLIEKAIADRAQRYIERYIAREATGQR